jgi:hypothetical protein
VLEILRNRAQPLTKLIVHTCTTQYLHLPSGRHDIIARAAEGISRASSQKAVQRPFSFADEAVSLYIIKPPGIWGGKSRTSLEREKWLT